MRARSNIDWTIPDGTVSVDQAQLAVLMDIREELRSIRTVIQCSNFTQIPTILRSIRRNTTKSRKPRARKRGKK